MLNIHPSILLFLQKTPELHSQQTFKPVPKKLSCAFNFPKIRNLLPNSRYKSQEAFVSFYFLVFLTERFVFCHVVGAQLMMTLFSWSLTFLQ